MFLAVLLAALWLVAESAGTICELPDTMQSHLQFTPIKETSETCKASWLSEDLDVT